MPMLHLDELGYGMGDAVSPLPGPSVPGQAPDQEAVRLAQEKYAQSRVDLLSDADAYQIVSYWSAHHMSDAELNKYAASSGFTPARVQTIRQKATRYVGTVPINTSVTLAATQTWWGWLQGQHIIPGVPDWATVGVAAAGVLYLMFKSKG
jgi:hypothetical protein